MLTPSPSNDDQDAPTIIEAGSTGLRAALGALWQNRDLVRVLAVRDVKLRYQHTVVGFAWVLLQPLLIMLGPKYQPLKIRPGAKERERKSEIPL